MDSPSQRDGLRIWLTPIDWISTVLNVVIIKETLHQTSNIHTCKCVLIISGFFSENSAQMVPAA